MKLILASASRYRRHLLERLGLPFEVVPAAIDETPLPAETPKALAQRLAQEKAQHVAQMHPDALVIGSDQVAALGNECLGKPGHHDAAVRQLKKMSGQTVVFYTAVCVYHRQQHLEALVPTHCQFRQLDEAEIQYYLHQEQPYDTAGSAKAESLGISLMHSLQSDDPTAIIGLPLIALNTLLRQFGLNPLRHAPEAISATPMKPC